MIIVFELSKQASNFKIFQLETTISIIKANSIQTLYHNTKFDNYQLKKRLENKSEELLWFIQWFYYCFRIDSNSIKTEGKKIIEIKIRAIAKCHTKRNAIICNADCTIYILQKYWYTVYAYILSFWLIQKVSTILHMCMNKFIIRCCNKKL